MNELVFDFETTIHNKGNPFDKRNFAVSYSTYWEGRVLQHVRYDDLTFKGTLENALVHSLLLIGHNLKFDLHWARNLGITPNAGCRVWDTQLAQFVLSGQTHSFASLNELAELYSLPTKLDEVKDYWEKGISTEDIPPEVLEEYNNYDVELTWKVYQAQLKDERMTPELHKLILLQGLDLLVLQEMEYNGLKYDIKASEEAATKLSLELLDIDQRLDRYSNGINYNSGDQLSCFLFGGTFEQEIRTPETRVYKSGPRKGTEYVADRIERRSVTLPGYFKPNPNDELKKTKGVKDATTRFYSTAADVLQQLKATAKVQKDILALLSRRAYIEKLVGTYLKALPELIREKHWGEYLHGQYNQCVARTGRLSSSNPNLQNQPGEVDQFIVSRYE
jgi:DNA polymerase I-like protein with 3'-5' exonuclease and polymerase domains